MGPFSIRNIENATKSVAPPDRIGRFADKSVAVNVSRRCEPFVVLPGHFDRSVFLHSMNFYAFLHDGEK